MDYLRIKRVTTNPASGVIRVQNVDIETSLSGGDTVIKTQSHGPGAESRQFFSLGNGDSIFTAQPDAVNIFDIKLDVGEVGADDKCELFGGEYWTNGNGQEGDYIEFSVMDLDDVLGYGPGPVELSKYVRRRPVVANEHGFVRPGQASELVKGLYLRTIYVATAAGAARKLRVAFDLAK